MVPVNKEALITTVVSVLSLMFGAWLGGTLAHRYSDSMPKPFGVVLVGEYSGARIPISFLRFRTYEEAVKWIENQPQHDSVMTRYEVIDLRYAVDMA